RLALSPGRNHGTPGSPDAVGSRRTPFERMDPAIRAVTFDVGGTLIEPWPSVGHVYAEVATKFGMDVDPAALNRSFAAAWTAGCLTDYSRAAWRRLVDRTFIATQSAPPAEACFDAIYRRFAERSAW